MTGTKGRDMLNELGINVEPYPITEPLDLNPIDGFAWDPSKNERQQKEEYKNYLQQHLADVLQQKNLCLVGVEEGYNVLSVSVPGHPIEFVGRADMLILDDIILNIPERVQELPRVRMVIEVKKDRKEAEKRLYQAVSELIALDLLASRMTMGLMTNLSDYWRFFWLCTDRTGLLSHFHLTSQCI